MAKFDDFSLKKSSWSVAEVSARKLCSNYAADVGSDSKINERCLSRANCLALATID